MAIELVDWSPPSAVVRIACSKGTYIRVLAEDIAGALGSCAHLSALRRTVSGPFSVAEAATLEALQAMDEPARDSLLLPPDAPLSGVARLDVDATTAQALVAGRIGVAPPGASGMYRCYGPRGRFVGLIESAGGALRSLRLARTDTRVEMSGLGVRSSSSCDELRAWFADRVSSSKGDWVGVARSPLHGG